MIKNVKTPAITKVCVTFAKGIHPSVTSLSVVSCLALDVAV